MQHSIPQRQNSHTSTTSTRLISARNHIRSFRQNLSQTFRRVPKHRIHTVPPPFLQQSLANDSVLSTEELTMAPSTLKTYAQVTSSAVDGSTERMMRRSQMSVSQSRTPQVASIFVHAGAGYHSTSNEHVHLAACDRYVISFRTGTPFLPHPCSITLEILTSIVFNLPHSVTVK